MVVPLIVLVVITVGLGFFQDSLERLLLGGLAGEAHVAWLPYVALGLALCGVVLAWVEFGRCGASEVGFVERIPPLYRLFARRWYLDHFYRLVLDRVVDRGFSTLFAQNDNKVIDGGLDAAGRATVEAGRLAAMLQSGMVQYRLIVVFAVLVLMCLHFFF